MQVNNRNKQAALPVGPHQQGWRQLQELVVLHIQDLHGGLLQPLRQPCEQVVSCQEFPETAITK